jgi:hypothetical protein
VSSAFFIVRYFSTKLAFFVLKDEKKTRKSLRDKKKAVPLHRKCEKRLCSLKIKARF